MEDTASEVASPSIEDLLGRGRVEMWRYYDRYVINNRRVSAEEYEKIKKDLYTYLDENCEKVDEVAYAPLEETPRRVALYECPIGKVGVFNARTVDSETLHVYVGGDAWWRTKLDSIDDIQTTINWILRKFEGLAEDAVKIEEELSNALEKVEKMPE
jgi:hypothetical protein